MAAFCKLDRDCARPGGERPAYVRKKGDVCRWCEEARKGGAAAGDGDETATSRKGGAIPLDGPSFEEATVPPDVSEKALEEGSLGDAGEHVDGSRKDQARARREREASVEEDSGPSLEASIRSLPSELFLGRALLSHGERGTLTPDLRAFIADLSDLSVLRSIKRAFGEGLDPALTERLINVASASRRALSLVAGSPSSKELDESRREISAALKSLSEGYESPQPPVSQRLWLKALHESFAMEKSESHQFSIAADLLKRARADVVGKALDKEREGQLDKGKKERKANFDRAGGRNVSSLSTSEALIKKFALKNLQWGEYVSEKERPRLLERAAGALSDLADVLGVDDGKLSIGGLSLAIGARGRGGAALAHYEPEKHIVNMTKTRGDGSLAHEWFHAFDWNGEGLSGNKDGRLSQGRMGELLEAIREAPVEEYRARKKKEIEDYRAKFQAASAEYDRLVKNSPYADAKKEAARLSLIQSERSREYQEARRSGDETKTREALEALRQAQAEALAAREKQRLAYFPLEIIRKIANSNGKGFSRCSNELRQVEMGRAKPVTKFYEDAVAIDKTKKGAYWSRPSELGARAFETYVSRRLKREGRESGYLVSLPKPKEGAKVSAYPTIEEEMSRMEAAFDALFDRWRSEKE